MDTQTLLHRSVDTILPTTDQLEQALAQAEKEGRKLRAYLGIDPTSPHLHIGHSVAIRKLAHFQQAGHQAILLIGDFTARLGDPDKTTTRAPLTKEQVEENMASYLDQAGKILDLNHPTNPVEIRHNSEWSDPMTFSEIIKLAANFTVQQMIERDMFAKRLQDQKPISLSEFFYPLMQGYDAVALEADVQLGGTDQTFNMLAGRTLNRILRNKEMFVLTTPLLADGNGVKIGKTMGNAINIDNPANELFGQIMSLPDEVIVPGFTLLTEVPLTDIETIDQQLKDGANPIDFKKKLALTITAQYHDQLQADMAQTYFEQTVQNRQLPTELDQVATDQNHWDILDLLVNFQLVDSKSKARQLFDQGALELNGQKITDRQLDIPQPAILKYGKHQFVKIVVN